MIVRSPSPFAPPAPPAVPSRGVSRRGLLKAGIGLAGLGGLVLPGSTTAYAAAEAANDLLVTDYWPVPPAWPDTHRLSITVVADLHAGGPNMGLARVRQVVDAANALGSDLTVVLGDYFATHRFVTEKVPHAAWAAELARLKAPLGVYTILGNHDWWYDIEGVRKALAAVHLPVMQNDAVLLRRAGPPLLARRTRRPARLSARTRPLPWRRRPAGHTQTHHHRRPGDPAGARAGYFPQRAGTRRADARRAYAWRADRVADMPPLWTPSQYGARFAYGHIVEQDRHMIVSGGLGTSFVPLRLGVPPEVVRVRLGRA